MKTKIQVKKSVSILVVIALIFGSSLANFLISRVYAVGLITSSSIQMSDSRPGQSGTTYTAVFTPTASEIGCINIVFATNADMTGGAPSGMVNSSAAKTSIAGTGITNGNWSLTNSTPGTLSYKTATPETPSSAVTAITNTITNSTLTTIYAQIYTYTTNSCATPVDTSNVIALATVGGVTASVTVAPTISFAITDYGTAVNGSGDTAPNMVAATSSAIAFGTVAAGATKWGSQTLTISTNGAHGYTLYIRDSQSMTDANSDTIHDQTGTPSSGAAYDNVATNSNFGYTTDASAPYNFGGTSNYWAGLTQTNVAINAKTAAVNADATNIEYKIRISNVQPPGTYSTVIAYTATPSY
jgi:hypothetical protein